jgi:hypothetical protein
MNAKDFADTNRFQDMGELVLTETAFPDNPTPRVTAYLEKSSNVAYQVCLKSRLYRHTEKPRGVYEALPYGKWQKLD